jgi:hypothetical protein
MAIAWSEKKLTDVLAKDYIWTISMASGAVVIVSSKHMLHPFFGLCNGCRDFVTSKSQLFQADDGKYYAYGQIVEVVEEVVTWLVTYVDGRGFDRVCKFISETRQELG